MAVDGLVVAFPHPSSLGKLLCEEGTLVVFFEEITLGMEGESVLEDDDDDIFLAASAS